ncbi:AraC family transcriptional regulator [Tenacibaculum skagerrakense]|uniref:AraC family transcriptional regulator n=1 Tax=Tenacibaculum skagerrakense TaxID=186571 RepID=A0A4R2NLU9_9FLAO|nr:AraC family transcriptional regulator [Tenacibaculum skagerrakense]TCP22613.1 AraC family transcriptional regulator [Tenacibaculum skagerrakense]
MITSNSILFTIICVFAIQAIVLSILILKKQPRVLANKFLAMLIIFYAIMAVNIVLVNVLKDIGKLHIFRYIQLELLYGMGPALYFYTISITKPNFKFSNKDFIHFIPLLLEFIFYRTSFYRDGANGLYIDPMSNITYVYLTQQWIGVLSNLIYSIISLRILYKHQHQLKQFYSKLENRSYNWLKIPILIFAIYPIFWNILTEIDRFAFDRNLREYYFLPNFVLLAIACTWISFKGYLTTNTSDLLSIENSNSSPKEITFELDKNFIEKLERLMQNEKPYLNPDLNLSKLSELLEMKPKQVSMKINQNFEKNFYDLVNSFRVKEFQERVKATDLQKISLLGLAYDCGFNSKSTFNSAFKKETQQTPSQLIKRLKNKYE